MRNRLAPLFVIALLVAALVAVQRDRATARVGADSVLYLLADSQHELTRLPSNFTRLSDQAETAAGAGIAARFLTERGALSGDNAIVEAYLQKIGATLAPHAMRKLRYQFHLVPDRTFVNAFAVPGGHIFIGTGLLEQMTTDDQLASVLAHEMEHVDHYHCAERLQVEAALRKIPLARLLEIPIVVFHAGYSKDQELEADREGVRLAAVAGYSAMGAIDLFEAFERLEKEHERTARTPQQELASVATGAVTGYFRSHPPTADRIAQVKTMIAREPALAARPQQKLEIAYVFLALQSRDSIEREKFDEAVDRATRALAMKPDHVGALVGLSEGSYGLGRYAAAQQAYRTVLAIDSTAADAIAKWADSRAEQLSSQRHYDRTIPLVSSVLELQPDHPALLRLLGLAQAQSGESEGAKKSGETMRRLYPDDASKLADEAGNESARLITVHDFKHAAALASFGLALKPGTSSLLQNLGTAEFAQAHFAESAAAFEQMFDESTSDATWLRSFADALGAARPATAVHELQSVLAEHKPQVITASDIQVETAGLALLSGDETPAHEVRAAVAAGRIAPEVLGRLAWWYFRAHRVDDAAALLSDAEKMRPGDVEVQNARAWVGLEKGIAIHPPVAAAPESALQSAVEVREALAAWQMHRVNDALRSWETVAHDRPQWLNPAWRAALYPPRINALAQQIEAERQRRAEAEQASLTARRRPRT